LGVESSIEWTQATWNPVTGCTKISRGCANCYAERLAMRLKAMGNARYRNGFAVTVHPDLLDLPLRWSKPRMIFVNSMSDIFHDEIPDDFIYAVFATMNKAKMHTFQVLTKRPERVARMAVNLPWLENIWLGATIESNEVVDRIEILQNIPATVRFLSIEPLLGPINNLPLEGIHWVIVGGESGPHAREMKGEWVRNIRAQCLSRRVPFFFKQWGGVNKKANGRLLDGRTWDQVPFTPKPGTKKGIVLDSPAFAY